MEDGGGVIHHTKGIHRCTEFLLLEPSSDFCGKAGAYKKHLLAWSYLETRFLNIDNRPKIHNSKL